MEFSSDEEYEPEYEWEDFEVAVENNTKHTFSVLCVVPPPLEYMSKLHTDQQEISGRQVWTGSLMACHYLSRNPSFVFGKSVLELGSGTGVLGMLASRLCARCVALTDGDELSVCLLKQNLERNKIQNYDVMSLLWGNEESMITFSSRSNKTWPQETTTSNGVVQFDRIVAGDVMYKRELPPLFFETVNRFLARDGYLLLFHVPRSCVDHEMVCSSATKASLCISKIGFELPNIEHVIGISPDDANRGALYIMQKTNTSG